MVIKTANFGEIDIREEDVLVFEDGLPGFENRHKFGFVKSGNPDSPFIWIQSLEDTELAFALVDPFAVKKDYDFELKEDNAKQLGIEESAQVLVYAIVVVPEDIKKISMNLKAPIIINKTNNMAAQIILDTDKYTVRHLIMDELLKREV